MLSLTAIIVGIVCFIAIALASLAFFLSAFTDRNDGVGKARQGWIEGESSRDK